jgi:hypothetical protein
VELEGPPTQITSQLTFDFIKQDRRTTQGTGLAAALTVLHQLGPVRWQFPCPNALVRKLPQIYLSSVHLTPSPLSHATLFGSYSAKATQR